MRQLAKTLALSAALALAACANTKVLSTWRDPSVGKLSFHRILVIAPSKDPALRRTAEDELVRELKGVTAVASYTLLPDADLGNNEEIRARAKSAGFDGVVVMRLVSVNKEATWVPGAVVGPYYAYGGWPAYDPGYFEIDTYVRMETNVYAVPQDKLVWSSASRTVNPSSVRSLVDDTTHAVVKAMEKEGLVP